MLCCSRLLRDDSRPSASLQHHTAFGRNCALGPTLTYSRLLLGSPISLRTSCSRFSLVPAPEGADLPLRVIGQPPRPPTSLETMAGNLPIASSKAAVPSIPPSAPQTSSAALSSGDTSGQRRVGGSGSFGAGAASRGSGSPRSSQGQRKQNKSSKRYQRFADEDAMAETVRCPVYGGEGYAC